LHRQPDLQPATTQPAKTVSVEDARRAAPRVVEPDEKAAKEDSSLYAHQQATQRASLGAIGWFLGASGEKPGNVAAIVILFCFAIIAWAYGTTNFTTDGESFFKLLAAMLGPIGLALGYLFGSSKRD
jgi:hypothetical protein